VRLSVAATIKVSRLSCAFSEEPGARPCVFQNGALQQSPKRHEVPENPPALPHTRAGFGFGTRHIFRRYLSLMLETAIALIVGFALGYGVREWVFRQYRRAEQRRRRPF
jgi:hypothetical protein